jgi:hypothetical protein
LQHRQDSVATAESGTEGGPDRSSSDAFLLRPTPWSIKRGSIVLARRFVEANAGGIDWHSFNVMLLGKLLPAKKRLDAQRRVSLPIREHFDVGSVIRFHVRGGKLVVEDGSSPVTG